MSQEYQHPPIGSIGWIDIAVPDAPAIRDFYKAVVGWRDEAVEMGGYQDYSMLPPGDSARPAAGICHQRGVNGDIPSHWLIYITVADLEASLEATRRLGGKLIHGPRFMGRYGTFAVIQDPAGAIAGLIQPPKP